MKSFLAFLLVVAVIAAGTCGYVYNDFAGVPALKNPSEKEWILDVTPQSTFSSVKNSLAASGVEISKIPFKVWIAYHKADRKLRAGEYKINSRWSQMQILDHLLTGDSIQHKLVIKEGHNIWDLFASLQNASFADTSLKDLANFRELMGDPRWVARMQVTRSNQNETPTLEGFLFPETYSYQKYDSPKKIIESMLQEFESRALPILKQHPWGATPQGRYRLLTLASIVEKESGVFAEQPLIASVFWNRLQKKMRLQSDPTIIYALLPEFDGNIRKSHITAPTPYNTYTIPELPVGPISNPGESALRAVVSPATTDYLFFVSKGDGTHVFSKDYKTHSNYVEQYQLRRQPSKNQ